MNHSDAPIRVNKWCIPTTVIGPGILSFYWRISSVWSANDLTFSIDGSKKTECLGYSSWSHQTFTIPAGTHVLKWDFINNTGDQAGYLDKVEYFRIPLAEALDNETLIWTTGGDAEWFGQPWVSFDGEDAAQSGKVGSDQASWLQTTVTGPGIVVNRWRLSVSAAWGDLSFQVDEVTKKECWEDQKWERVMFAIPSGSHSLKWIFAPFSGGEGFVDQVEFIHGPAILVGSPEAGEVWYHRDYYSIRWASTEDLGTEVKIELFQGENENPIYTISPATENDGNYLWFVPNSLPPAEDYRIKITPINNPAVYDYSDGSFAIRDWALSYLGGYLILDGVDDYAKTPDHAELYVGDEPGESFTIETWVYFRGFQHQGVIYKPGGYFWYGDVRVDPYPYQRWDCIGFDLIEGGGMMSCHVWPRPGGWHHLAAVYDSSSNQLTYYINGENIFSAASNLLANDPDMSLISDQSLYLGQGWWDTDNYFLGVIDEVRISDSIRYTANFAPPTTTLTCDAHTRALWHFDEPEGATVFHDACGFDNVLTGYNGAHAEGVFVQKVFLPLSVKKNE
jgi:hypothetical protein